MSQSLVRELKHHVRTSTSRVRTRIIVIDKAPPKIEYKLNILILEVVHGHVVTPIARPNESSGGPGRLFYKPMRPE